jgi:hypothetical protein
VAAVGGPLRSAARGLDRAVAEGHILNKDPHLLMFDEEVPREGVHVSRHYQLAHWTDGSTWAWMALRKTVGRGEGSSGLRFDSLNAQ